MYDQGDGGDTASAAAERARIEAERVRDDHARAEQARQTEQARRVAVVNQPIAPSDFARAAERERIRHAAGIDDDAIRTGFDTRSGEARAVDIDAFRTGFDTRTGEVRGADTDAFRAGFDARTGEALGADSDGFRAAAAARVDVRTVEASRIDARDVNERARITDAAIVADARAQFAATAHTHSTYADPAVHATVDARVVESRPAGPRPHDHDQLQDHDGRFGGTDPRQAFVIDDRDPNRPHLGSSAGPGGRDPRFLAVDDPNHPDHQLRQEWDEVLEARAEGMHAAASRVMSIHTFGGDDGAASDQWMGEGITTAKGTTRAPDDPYARYRGAVDKAQQELGQAGRLDADARRALASGRDPYMVMERQMNPD